jgi:protein-disulfide isomerase
MIRRFLAVFSLFLALTAPVFAADAFTPAQKTEIENIIKTYITAHPDVMISSVETYYNKKQAESNADQGGKVDNAPPSLLNDPNSPTIGPKDAKVAVIEFFDYNCGYCKQVASDVERLVKENKDKVKFVFKELPILADSSKVAARYALAANKQGKYWEFHSLVMLHQGPMDESYLNSAAKDAGVDLDKLKKDIDSPEIIDELSKTVDLARALGVRGTPFFVIGKEKVPGAVTYEQMKDALDRALGVKSSVVMPGSTSSTTTTTKTTASTDESPIVPVTDPLKGTEPSDNVADDPQVKAEIAKARAETSAMIEEIKKQAEEIKKQAVEANAKATAAAEAQAKANAAAQAAAKK